MAVLDIFFRFLNFALFAGVIGYYFRSRLLANIYAHIKAKITSQKATILAIKQAQGDLKEAQNEIEVQEKEYSALQAKIELWKKSLKQKEEVYAQRQALLHERLQDRVLLREKTQALCAEAQKIFPVIMEQAAKELKSAFIERKYQQNYDQKAIDALERI